MPVAVERKLKREARVHGFKRGSKRFNKYVYGTLAKIKKHLSTRRKVRGI